MRITRAGQVMTEKQMEALARGRQIANANKSTELTRTPGYREWQKQENNRRKRTNGGSHTFGEWEILKAQYDWTCPACGIKEPEIKLSQDHIIPVSKGGSDNIENIQPLCMPCNIRKMTKIIKYSPLSSKN